MVDTHSILQLEGVGKTFSTDPPVRPLDGLDLKVEAGEMVCISGVSGKGKTTLLNIAGGIMCPTEGKVLFCGEDIVQASVERIDALHRSGIGFVFQVPHLVDALTVRENLLVAAKVQKLADGAARADMLLRDFGLEERADNMPHELSVGQKRRVVVARALMGDHRLILADEPTNDLDAAWSDYVFERFRSFADDGERAVVYVTHDATYVQRADKTYELQDGHLVSKGWEQ